jgi:hypothetical protein
MQKSWSNLWIMAILGKLRFKNGLIPISNTKIVKIIQKAPILEENSILKVYSLK